MPPTQAAYADFFDRLEKRVERGFGELNEGIKALDTRIRAIENSEAGCRGVQELHIQSIKDKQQDQERRLDEVEKWIPAVKVLVWIGGGLGLSVIGLIWGILTHAVEIAVK